MILVSIDTLRADHVGVRNLTPSLDAFAKTAMRFTSAWSHAPLTLPAHASILTGLLPTTHGVRDTNLNADPSRPGAAMARYLGTLRENAKSSSAGPISQETEERLRSLGYLGATRASKNSSSANPRNKLRFYQPFMTAFTEAHAARGRGDLPSAVEQYRRAIDLLRLEEGLVVPKLHFGLGDSLARLGRTDAALKAFRAELGIDPANIETRTALGSLYWSMGRDRDARGVITGIVTENPKAGEREHAAVSRAFEVLGDATARRPGGSGCRSGAGNRKGPDDLEDRRGHEAA